MKPATGNTTRLSREGDIVRINGAMTFATVASVLRDSKSMFSESGERLVIDLAGVESTDSAALALLLEWKRWGARENREVCYQGLPDRLQQLAGISEVESVLLDE